MTTSEAIKWAGGPKALADRFGIRRQNIYKWGETPPLDRQCQLEVMSNGALVADVPPEFRARLGAAA